MAVINSIKNLVLTNHYERPFQPDIGSNIRRLLFENMDTITASSIEREIEQTISNYEPRARVSRINAIADFDRNGFKVEMEFFVINRTDPITINFFLERIR
jgi:phage baseplate assembly protein W